MHQRLHLSRHAARTTSESRALAGACDKMSSPVVVHVADETVYELTVPTDQDLSLMDQAFSVLAQFACAIRWGQCEGALPCMLATSCRCTPCRAEHASRASRSRSGSTAVGAHACQLAHAPRRCAPGDLDKERGAVLEEWRMGRDSAGRAQEAHWQLIMKGCRVRSTRSVAPAADRMTPLTGLRGKRDHQAAASDPCWPLPNADAAAPAAAALNPKALCSGAQSEF